MDEFSKEARRKAPELEVKYDAAFCVVGTRFPTELNEPDIYKVDVELVKQFAELSKAKQVDYFALQSFVYATPNSTKTMSRMKGFAEAIVKDMRFKRVSFFRPAWISRPKPKRSEFKDFMQYFFARFDHWLRHNFRFTLPFMYIPVAVLPSNMKSVEPDTLARAMVNDALRHFSGADKQEMARKIGWRGLKRVYYPEITSLAK
jgi:hypothetical protein